MMTLIVKAARVLYDADERVISGGEVVIDQGRVREVRSSATSQTNQVTDIVDLAS